MVKMQISTKTGYAVRALSVLAKQPHEKPLSIAVLCKDQNLPKKYIEQLFRKLKQKDLIKSVHGSKGGYIINKTISEISLKDIMIAVEDNFPTSSCYGNSSELEYCSGMPCAFYDFWDDIKKNIEKYLDSITLDQIVSRI